MKARFLPEARVDLNESIDFLLERNPAAAADFVAEVDSAIKFLLANLQAGELGIFNLRRWNIQRFGHSIYYQTQSETLYIFAVYHNARDLSQLGDRTAE